MKPNIPFDEIAHSIKVGKLRMPCFVLTDVVGQLGDSSQNELRMAMKSLIFTDQNKDHCFSLMELLSF